MVRPNRVSIWGRHFPSTTADRSVSDVWWNALRRALLYGPGTDRTAFRYRSRPASGHGPRVHSAVSPRLVALLYLVAFQTNAAVGYRQARKSAGRCRPDSRRPATNLLERRRQGSASLARRNISTS